MKSRFAALLKLPFVFDHQDVSAQLGVDTRLAVQQCYRWKNEGLIRPTGPVGTGDPRKKNKGRTGVFYNLVRDDNPENHLMEAIAKSIKQPMVVVGAFSINAGGWCPQMPKVYDIAVPATRSSRSYPKIEGARVLKRPPSWFRAVWSASSEYALSSIRMAPPEYGLVDYIRSLHVYDTPEGIADLNTDISPLEDAPEAIEMCYRAALAIGFSPEKVRDHLRTLPYFENDIDDVSIDDVRTTFDASKLVIDHTKAGDGTVDGLRAFIEESGDICVVIGDNALKWGDYTTLGSRICEVAVPEGQAASLPETEGVVFVERAQEWLDVVLPIADPNGWGGMPTAPAQHALVDIISRSDEHLQLKSPHASFSPSDICLYVMDDKKVVEDCYAAALELDVPIHTVRGYLSRVQELVWCIDQVPTPDDHHPGMAP